MAADIAWLPRETAADGPLAGIRVLDFSEQLPGPFLTQNLAEMGADVLKLERPSGDPTRRSSPPLFQAVNRGKRCLNVDLKSDAGVTVATALLADADVLVEAYRPGVMDRLGLGFATLQARHPGLVYVSLTGYGATGPHAGWPGHDINYLAASGIADLSTKADGELHKPGVPLADLTGSVYALACVNAALLQRHRTGRGQHLDVSLADCATQWAGLRLASLRNAGGVTRPLAAYGVFTCRDGLRLSLGALEDHFWAATVRVLDLRPFAADAYRRRADREKAWEQINDAVARALVGLDRDEAVRLLAEADVPVFEVVPATALASSAQATARSLFDSAEVCRFPVRMAGMATRHNEGDTT